jgi:Deoxyribonuclease NucA/NucB
MWYNPWAPPIFAAPRPEPLPLPPVGNAWGFRPPIFPPAPDGAGQAAATPLQLPAGNPWGSAPPIFPPAPANDAGQPAPPKPSSALPDWMKPFVTAPPPPLFFPQGEPTAASQPSLSDRTKDLPDMGGPLIGDGGPFSSGLPAVNRLADSASASIGKAISNVPASAYTFGKGVVQPFIHPVDTLEGFKNLGLGVLEKAGIKGGAEHEKYADALGRYFADRYGSLENLRRTFEQDPVGLAGDLSSLFTAGVPLAGVRAAGVLGRAGKVAGTVERAGAAGAAAGEIRSAINVAREGAAADIGSALKAEAPAAADAAAVVAKELPVLYFDRAVMPNIVAHIEKAIAEGKPDVLTRRIDQKAKIANRKEALKDLPELPSTHSWDEYPFASVREGGKGASTARVPRPEQDIQGWTMSKFYRQNKIAHHDQFRVGISPPPPDKP